MHKSGLIVAAALIALTGCESASDSGTTADTTEASAASDSAASDTTELDESTDTTDAGVDSTDAPATTRRSTTSTSTSSTTTSTTIAPTTTLPKPIAFSGRGDDVIELPVDHGRFVLAATHKGSANFIIEGLDADLQMASLPINEIGAFTGSVMLNNFGDPTEVKFLKVTANGAWTVELLDLSALRQFDDSISGTGPEVVLYTGDTGVKAITHSGSSNFVITTYDPDESFPDLLVNEIGAYEGRQPFGSGPALVAIVADGTWSIS